GASVATFLAVFLVVSELLLPYVEFSVLIGIPTGIVIGALIGAFVLLQMEQETNKRNQRIAYSLGIFGMTVLVVFAIVVSGFRRSITISLFVSIIVGVIFGLGSFYLWT
ncbi:MAG: hypothetical protein ABEI86_09605, partial [Halobacteriaceae archaeon]